MPIYEYECQKCCHRFELRQSFDDKPADTCPQCQGSVRRILSAVPVIFKGSGFYITDSRGKEPQPESSAGNSTPGAKEKTEKKAAP